MRTLCLSAVLLAAATPCLAGSIGLYGDPGGQVCNLLLPQDGSTVMYAIGRTSSADPDGGFVDAGEFRIVGLPSAWFATAVHDPSMTVAIGDPLGDGVVFGWASVQGGVIPLFTIAITATTQEANVELRVVKHVRPSPPFGFPTTCPWFHYPCGGACDNSAVCVEGVSLFVNGSCPVGVDPRSWSTVRALYR